MKNKKRTILSSKQADIEHMDFLSRYLGKKVFSQSGEQVGIIKDVVFEKGMHRGFLLDKNLFIDKEYFTKDFEDAMMLEMNPVTLLVGKLVFDADGKKVGKVIDIERNNNANDYKSILVKKNIFSKPLVVEKREVDITKKNIILNTAK